MIPLLLQSQIYSKIENNVLRVYNVQMSLPTINLLIVGSMVLIWGLSSRFFCTVKTRTGEERACGVGLRGWEFRTAVFRYCVLSLRHR